ncbi:MAG: hypothetical protein AAFO77_04555 [Pseudomonadota bacterium]
MITKTVLALTISAAMIALPATGIAMTVENSRTGQIQTIGSASGIVPTIEFSAPATIELAQAAGTDCTTEEGCELRYEKPNSSRLD